MLCYVIAGHTLACPWLSCAVTTTSATAQFLRYKQTDKWSTIADISVTS